MLLPTVHMVSMWAPNGHAVNDMGHIWDPTNVGPTMHIGSMWVPLGQVMIWALYGTHYVPPNSTYYGINIGSNRGNDDMGHI